jgi:hypothetical protein
LEVSEQTAYISGCHTYSASRPNLLESHGVRQHDVFPL